ncbi:MULTISPECIES: nucleotidyltransferase family protein [unclassified Brenneria]|uniref:nucleotidyltransferase family protein n=1 Tax=unclassified Brenneria TaxID=2634434 RepID=UPI0018F07A48|nr:nucleotidyltransferase family protein [Brenneria sp. L3-3C-1]MBJ7224152.1 nucleotidyltransferase family protein [Brenneria sp. L3-3C-1]MEE3645398.1 nucleotidyltransferase family protein [Brenneria sp. L3_3C_1]
MHNIEGIKNITVLNIIFNDYLGIEHDVNISDIVNADLHFLGKHKLISIWYDLITKKGLVNKLSSHINYMVSSYISYVRREQELKIQEMKKIGGIFDQNNLPYAVRKGMALSSFYQDNTHRIYNDMDLLVESSSVDKYRTLLHAQGYIEGLYDYSKKEIVSHSRSDLIKYRLSPDHHPHMLKVIDGVPVYIDLAFTSCWHMHADEKYFSINNVDSEDVDGIRCLARESLYYDTIFHLYRESRFVSSLENRPPYFLSYLDLMLLIRKDNQIFSADFKENDLIKEDISTLLSNDIDKILNHEAILNDFKNRGGLKIFSYMSKSSTLDDGLLHKY